MTDWSSDEFSGFGSYSNFPTHLAEGDIDIKVIREGLPDRSLWFAGEHVAPFMALGTVNGAYGMLLPLLLSHQTLATYSELQ